MGEIEWRSYIPTPTAKNPTYQRHRRSRQVQSRSSSRIRDSRCKAVQAEDRAPRWYMPPKKRAEETKDHTEIWSRQATRQ